MTTKEKIQKEVKEVYLAIKYIVEKEGYGYCQSWWLNARNFHLNVNCQRLS